MKHAGRDYKSKENFRAERKVKFPRKILLQIEREYLKKKLKYWMEITELCSSTLEILLAHTDTKKYTTDKECFFFLILSPQLAPLQ